MNFTDPRFEDTVQALIQQFKTAFVPETYREVALSRIISELAHDPSTYLTSERATLSLRECTEAEMQDHVIQLAALGMCCIDRPLWEGRSAIEEYLRRHFIPRRQKL